MKTPKNVLDRRRSLRVVEKLPFTIGHQNYEIEATTVNISVNGVLCVVKREIPLMTQLKVAITLPSGATGSSKKKIILMKGVVVRKEKDSLKQQHLLAIYFSEIKPADKKFLKKFIESHLHLVV